MRRSFIKSVKVSNPHNQVIQIPRKIMQVWGITDEDSVRIVFDEVTKELIVSPAKGYVPYVQVSDE